ncbi:MAG: FixH family protein [Flavobacteriaceae bacterium]|nr:FixH family protein [Flavobacteriaceae bacterium]
MKIKIHWGTAMVIAMIAFMVFILQFVYRTLAVDKYNHQMVSEDYYKDELYYQKELDKLNNASRLPQNVIVEKVDGGLLIQFPADMEASKISGTASFQRPSDQKLDFTKDIVLTNKNMLVQNERLIRGKWNIRVDWKYEGVEYLLKESVFY